MSGSFQGFDQTYLLDALARLGLGGVAQLLADTPDDLTFNLMTCGTRLNT